MEHPPEQKIKKENIREMEVGRLAERLREAVNLIPGIIADVARIYAIALRSLGKSEEETKAELDKLHQTMMDKVESARSRADQRFEEKTAA